MYEVLIVGVDSALILDRWLELRREHRLLVPVEQFTELSPFNRELKLQPAPHSAEAVEHGLVFGQLWWDGGRLLCPLELPEHNDRLQSLAVDIAVDLRSSITIVDFYDLELRDLR